MLLPFLHYYFYYYYHTCPISKPMKHLNTCSLPLILIIGYIYCIIVHTGLLLVTKMDITLCCCSCHHKLRCNYLCTIILCHQHMYHHPTLSPAFASATDVWTSAAGTAEAGRNFLIFFCNLCQATTATSSQSAACWRDYKLTLWTRSQYCQSGVTVKVSGGLGARLARFTRVQPACNDPARGRKQVASVCMCVCVLERDREGEGEREWERARGGGNLHLPCSVTDPSSSGSGRSGSSPLLIFVLF